MQPNDPYMTGERQLSAELGSATETTLGCIKKGKYLSAVPWEGR